MRIISANAMMAAAIEMPALAPVESADDGGSGGAGASLVTRSMAVEVAAAVAVIAVVGNPKEVKGSVMSLWNDADDIGAAKSPVVRYVIRNWTDKRRQCNAGDIIVIIANKNKRERERKEAIDRDYICFKGVFLS
jgi:hypothetical protein